VNDPRRAGLVLAEHEPAADRVVGAGGDLAVGLVDGGEPHRVGVEGQPPAAVQHDVLGRVEVDLTAGGEAELAGLGDAGDHGLGGRRVHRLRRLSRQSQHDGLHAAVPCPVAPSEPNSSALIPATRPVTPSAASECTNIPAARIGPTVCELDGPMPILKRSKALIVMSELLPP
jgi:hypothetical protein